jgi:hypothetical protein
VDEGRVHAGPLVPSPFRDCRQMSSIEH